MSFIQPVQITIMTTNTCTASCGHCSVKSDPQRRGALTAEQMCQAIEQFHQRHGIRLVVFAGGEPTLLGKALLEAIAYADGRGVMTRMVTNAHWATTPEEARRRILEFRAAGLRELNISCDDYHTPYVPLERLRHAWNAARDAGFDSVVIASASGPGSTLTPERIREVIGEVVPLIYDDDGAAGEPIRDGRGTVRVISNAQLARLGKGMDSIPDAELRFPRHQRELDQPCRWIRRSPAISPRNTLLSCCGMETNGRRHLDYGALTPDNLDALLESAGRDVYVRALGSLGPYRILETLRRLEPDLPFWDRYTGVCEVCSHIFDRPMVVDRLARHQQFFETLLALEASKPPPRSLGQELVPSAPRAVHP